jgi:predicted regulator of Ras-like GTPase activity (Roadblock/LC7/MglB family)
MRDRKLMVKKRSLSENMATIEMDALVEDEEIQQNSDVDDLSDFDTLLDTVEEIRKDTEVEGYILRNETKAIVDLNHPEKIIEYAILSSQAFESSETLAQTVHLGDIENLIVEGKDMKLLCINLGENRLSVFMNKNAPHTGILQTLST